MWEEKERDIESEKKERDIPRTRTEEDVVARSAVATPADFGSIAELDRLKECVAERRELPFVSDVVSSGRAVTSPSSFSSSFACWEVSPSVEKEERVDASRRISGSGLLSSTCLRYSVR